MDLGPEQQQLPTSQRGEARQHLPSEERTPSVCAWGSPLLRVGEPTPALWVTRLKRLGVHTPDRQPIEQQIIDKTEGMERDHYVERLTKHIKFLQVGQIKPWFNTMIHGSIHDNTAKTRREASYPWGRTAMRAENLLDLGSNIRNLTFYSV